MQAHTILSPARLMQVLRRFRVLPQTCCRGWTLRRMQMATYGYCLQRGTLARMAWWGMAGMSPKIFIPRRRILYCCSKQEAYSAKMSTTKSLSLAVFLFTALTLTHAAFVDYRSGAAETQPQFKAMQDNKMANQMLYLHTRKLAGAELSFDFGAGDRRGIWRGLTKSKWSENGLCCGVFELLVKMKGGRTRTMLLRSLLEPRNKLQLSHELGIDWKAVDGHMAKLLQYGLAAEVMAVGTCRVYAITQKGRRALELVDKLQEPSNNIECT